MLQLWFTDEERPELLKAQFESSHTSGPIISVRGKTPGAYRRGDATFQWTQAVQALCIFFLRCAEGHARGRHDTLEPVLSGDAGSPAASLDYAIGKPPAWLIEMFGESRAGEPYVRRVVARTNPERKRGGDVELSLNHAALPPHSIRIFRGKSLAQTSVELSNLCERIEAGWKVSGKVATRSPLRKKRLDAEREQKSLSGFVETLRECYADESVRSLQRTDIFTRLGIDRIRARIERDLTLAGEQELASRLLEGAIAPTSAERLGIVPSEWKRKLLESEPIQVAIPCGNPGATEIFFRLRDQERLPFEIDFQFQYAIEISRKILSAGFAEPPALCILGLAPAATLISRGPKTGYRPLMVMPSVSHRIVAPRSHKPTTSRLRRGELILLNEEFSTSQIYFDLLSYSGDLNKSKIKARHAEPDEAFPWLQAQEEERRALLFFPYHAINRRLNNCDYLDEVRGDTHIKDFILFAHEKLLSDPLLTQAIRAVIRDAWLRLRTGGPEYQQALSLMTGNTDFHTTLQRFSGLPPSPQCTRYRDGLSSSRSSSGTEKALG
ncbi:MAG: hypothetical protein U0136_08550 [Bdellovibrionota bacterium]